MKTWNGFEKGINLGGWLSQWDLTDREHLETFITEQDIQDIRAMGADHVRLPVDYSNNKKNRYTTWNTSRNFNITRTLQTAD